MGTVLFIILLVGLGAWMLRRFSSSEQIQMPDTPVDESAPDRWGDELETSADDEAVAVTSDGWGFMPHRGSVQIIPVATDDPWSSKSQMLPGDLIAARVKRGGPGTDPWVLECLGRDHDFRAWSFETESAAREALQLVERLIVKPPTDRDGSVIPVGDEDFFVALRNLERSAAQSTYDEPEELDDETR